MDIPVRALFNGKVLSHSAVYQHYKKWNKFVKRKSLCPRLFYKYRNESDTPSVYLDGSHTTELREDEKMTLKRSSVTCLNPYPGRRPFPQCRRSI